MIIQHFILFYVLSLTFSEHLDIGSNPYTKRLNSGNYIIISSKSSLDTNFAFYDGTLKTLIKSYNFNSNYDDTEYVQISAIEQFSKEDDGYIVVFIRQNYYIFDKFGNFLKNGTNSEIKNFARVIPISIITYGHIDNNYYFFVFYISSSNIRSIKFTYNKQDNIIISDEPQEHNINQKAGAYSSSCALMYNESEKIINCIYGGPNQYEGIFSSLFKVNNSQEINIFGEQINNDKANGSHFRIKAIPDDNKKAICCSAKVGTDSGNYNCLIYNITSNSFYDLKTYDSTKCINEFSQFTIEYFYESKTVLIGAIGKIGDNKVIYVSKYSSTLNFQTLSQISNEINCDEIRFNFVLPSDKNKYYILRDSSCNNYDNLYEIYGISAIQNKTDFPAEELNCSIYYNYDKSDCLDDIPSGYFCNSTTDKTIDKCHEDCETCNKAPSISNTNCLKCNSTDKYLNFGNCTDSCDNGDYIEDSIKKCKCSVIKCKECTEESLSLESKLCVSCNDEGGYYPKEDDEIRNDGYINCYKNPENYFKNENNKYQKCYESCKYCSSLGNNLDNKCTECKNNYETKNDFEDDNNCYIKCDYFYYFDSNKEYNCTKENSCPENYSKLIISKNRCIDECKNDNIYKYEYNNKCYSNETCPNKTIPDDTNYKCVLHCDSDEYYNYEKTECISGILDGYYCNDTTLKTLDKCHENCKTCEQGPTDTNNNCKLCPDNKYFDLGNCRDNCINGFFTDENNIKICKCSYDISCKYCNSNNQCESCNDGYYPKSDYIDDGSSFNCFKEPEGYYLSGNVYKPCYSTCKTCSELGDNYNHKCIECKSTHEFNNHPKAKEGICYENCSYFYYYDTNDNYICTIDNKCPTNYTIIFETNRCIDDCKNDEEYKYIYNNTCYKKCPRNSRSSLDDKYLCEEIIQNEDEKNKCNLKENNLDLFPGNLSKEFINNLTMNYAYNYGYFNNYIAKYENEYYIIYIYNNINCLKNISNEIPILDFGECYNKVKNTKTKNINEELIITLIIIKGDKNNKEFTTFGISDPETGEIINTKEICSDKDILIIEESITHLLEQSHIDKKKEKDILFLTKQGINVFNASDEFYLDICFYYESPNNKDIPMQDRIATYYQNITLCDQGCKSKGIDIDTKKVKCECSFNDFMNNKYIDNALTESIGDAIKIVNSLNIEVLECITHIFDKKRIKYCIGSLILLCLFCFKIIFIIFYAKNGLSKIKDYLFSLSECFNNYLKKSSPPKKDKKEKKKRKKKLISEIDDITINNKSKKILLSDKNLKFQEPIIDFKNMKKSKEVLSISKNETGKNIYAEKLEELLNPPFDEKDFDEVIFKDKRTFFQYFCEVFTNNNLFINTFFINEILKPRPLKIILLILTIELYLVVNALFYNEDYLSELFYSNKENKFFSFVPRRLNQFVYISLVHGIISYLIDFFFENEENIKRLFKQKKKNIKSKESNVELSLYINSLRKLFISFIFINIILSIIFIVYISCFNIVYPYIRGEWIRSSVFILILMQLINLAITFLHSFARYISIKCDSIKLFKLSLWLL